MTLKCALALFISSFSALFSALLAAGHEKHEHEKVAVDVYDAAQVPPLPKDAQDEWLRKAENFLSGIKTLKAPFIQVTAHTNGVIESRNGLLKWLRPGCVMFNYNDKPFLQVIADGEFFVQKDDDGTSSPIAIENTPAGLILKEKVDLKKDAVIHYITEKDAFIIISVANKDDPGSARLILVFKKSPFSLTQWTIIDTTGRITDVVLLNPEMNLPMQKSEFKID